MKKNTIIVVSTNFKKAYPILKSISGRGFYTIALFYLWRANIFSKYINKRIMIPDPYHNEKEYVLNILDAVKRYNPILIIPVGFIDVKTLSKYKYLFPKEVFIPVPSYDLLIKVSNKNLLSQYSEKIGFRYPKTLIMSQYSPKDVYNYLGLPMVVKGISDDSKPYYIFTTEHFNEFFKNHKLSNAYICQEFISGFGVGYFTFSIEGKPIIEFLHRRIIEKKPSGGPSIFACKYNDPKALKIGRKILKHLNWTGILMIEMKKDLEKGEYYVLEFNPKFWGSLELSFSIGINFVDAIIDSFIGRQEKNTVHKHFNKSGCFEWLLDGVKYLKENPPVWLTLLNNTFKNGFSSSDMHLQDPLEFSFSFLSRLLNLYMGNIPTADWMQLYKESLMRFLKAYRHRMFDIIISDLDNTLVNLDINWKLVKKILIQYELTDKYDSLMSSLYKLWVNDKVLFDKASKIVEEYESYAVNKLSRNQNIINSLSTLKKLGYRIGIVSKQSNKVINNILKVIGIANYIDAFVGREDAFLRLEQAKLVLERLGGEVEKTILVGDSLSDIASASHLNIWPIGISKNPYRYQQYFEYGVPIFKNIPDFVDTLKYFHNILR